MHSTTSAPEISNFGRNVRFRPHSFQVPKTEAELLEILGEHHEGGIRVVASKHAWSDSIRTDGLLIDMRHFDYVRIDGDGDNKMATVGAGCQIKRLLAELNKHGLTTPSVGLITEQTIAGAMATGTHGSGKNSLSHYAQSMRIACKPNGEPEIREINDGADLCAARCSLGCMGVVVDVTLPVVPQYYVEEGTIRCDSVSKALDSETEFPLQQFFLIPRNWDFYVQQRRVANQQKRSLTAFLYRVYWLLFLDVGFHALIKLFASILRSRKLIHFFYRWLLPCFVIVGWRVVDRSDRMLVMEHELFRHLELEAFVRRTHVEEAARCVAEILRATDTRDYQIPDSLREEFATNGLLDSFEEIRGVFTHHYPVCFRRILPDDTLISMSQGDSEDWYSISFITYVEPRDQFFVMAEFIAVSLYKLYGARIHWGKWFPLENDVVEKQYPKLSVFRDVCRKFDPRGEFQNRYTRQAMGFGRDLP